MSARLRPAPPRPGAPPTRRCAVLALAVAGLLTGPAAADRPIPLGPGHIGEPESIPGGECPTLRWTPAAPGAGAELVLFSLDDGEGGAGGPVLRVDLPAGSTAWSPPAGWCPVAGEAYAWAVRSVDPSQTSWSDPLAFRVEPAESSLADLVAALRRRIGDDEAETRLRELLERSPPVATRDTSPVDDAGQHSSRAVPLQPDPPAGPDGLRRSVAAASGGGPLALGADHLGTTLFQDLELRVDGGRALLLQPTVSTPNVVGGGAANALLHPDVVGVTISGGGSDDTASFLHHRVTDDYVTIGGGSGHIAGDGTFSTTDGWSTVGGGQSNQARRVRSTVGGGSHNSTNAAVATIAGGSANFVDAGFQAAIGGGSTNRAPAWFSVVPGGRAAIAKQTQIAYSSGDFADPPTLGASQWSLYVLRGTTTDATETALAIDASDPLELWGTVALDIQVVGLSTGGDAAAYAIQAVVEAASCAPTVIGTPTVTVLGENDPTWDVSIGTDAPNLAVEVLVTGAAATTIRWVATIHATVVDHDLGGC